MKIVISHPLLPALINRQLLDLTQSQSQCSTLTIFIYLVSFLMVVVVVVVLVAATVCVSNLTKINSYQVYNSLLLL